MEYLISQEEQLKFLEIFTGASPVNNKLSGTTCRDLFLKFGLPLSQLKEIWDLSDIDGDGSLDFDEFSVAMKLVSLLLTKQYYQLPKTLPDSLIPISKKNHSSNILSTRSFTPITTTEQRPQKESYSSRPFYSAFVQSTNGKDTISYIELSRLLKNSNIISDHILDTWNLVNIRNQDQINFLQFSALMQILDSSRKTGIIPTSLSEKDRIDIYDSLQQQPKSHEGPLVKDASNTKLSTLSLNYSKGSSLADSYINRMRSQSPATTSAKNTSFTSKSPLATSREIDFNENRSNSISEGISKSSFETGTRAVSYSQPPKLDKHNPYSFGNKADPKEHAILDQELEKFRDFVLSRKNANDELLKGLKANGSELVANSNSDSHAPDLFEDPFSSSSLSSKSIDEVLNFQISQLDYITNLMETEHQKFLSLIDQL
ncbi:hypothetical protein BB560_001523 [Smittium megazygosporum]|uniref:Endocytosis protein 3 n=1 Tax=Smittium megazygosporum TaxID=133381 RepID=A0A2T9ZHD6_9FUNG|nr:hypothetical protein BB560_001523 [Smittium megazygosporum]